MQRSYCFASFVRAAGSAELAPSSLQWRPLARKLPARRPLPIGCTASESDGNRAGAAAADAVFRHLDASLDDEDDEDIFYGQGENERASTTPAAGLRTANLDDSNHLCFTGVYAM